MDAALTRRCPDARPAARAHPQGKGYGVYRFADKYGANVDGYSPIYTPDRWTESGDSYKLGTKGLVAWWVQPQRGGAP